MRSFSSARYHLFLSFSVSIILGSSSMLSSFGARAFTAAARGVAQRSPFAAATTATTPTGRWMSGTPDQPDTSVVDVCTRKIGDALETEKVTVTGAYDDPNGSHVSIEVVSSLFEGKRAMQRQQLVYKAIWEELKGPVHAVDSMICKTPDEE